jgi:hypothetical protein
MWPLFFSENADSLLSYFTLKNTKKRNKPFFRPAGRVKYLDLDSVYLKPLVDRAIGEVGACTRHTDCDIFDCRGECDLVRGKCRSAVVNNNLQAR